MLVRMTGFSSLTCRKAPRDLIRERVVGSRVNGRSGPSVEPDRLLDRPRLLGGEPIGSPVRAASEHRKRHGSAVLLSPA
jgi:hypothetical protein